jgi:hypothetical protein
MVWASVRRMTWTSLRTWGLDFCTIVSKKLSFLRKPIHWGAVSSHTHTHTHTHTHKHWKGRRRPVIVIPTAIRTMRHWSVFHLQHVRGTAANDRKHYKMLKTAQTTPPLNTSKQSKHFFFDDPVYAHLPLLSSLPPGAANLSLYALKSLPSGESRVLTYSSLLCRSHGSPDCVSDSVLPSKTSTLHNDVTRTILTVLPWILKRSISRYRKLPKLHHCTL